MNGLLLIIIASLLVISPITGQINKYNAPDYNSIESKIKNKSSKYYYPKLFARYMAADTSLSLADFRYLYYGFTFQKAYEPFNGSKYRDSLLAISRKRTITDNDLKKIIFFTQKNLKKIPFDIRSLSMLDYAYYQLGMLKKSRNAAFKKQGIIDAILSSGTGITKNTAFHIIDELHKIEIIIALNYRYAGTHRITENACEYMEIKTNKDYIKGLYFNIKRLFDVSAERIK